MYRRVGLLWILYVIKQKLNLFIVNKGIYKFNYLSFHYINRDVNLIPKNKLSSKSAEQMQVKMYFHIIYFIY